MKKIYYNGNILTMSKQKHPECVITQDDKILYVGKLNKSGITIDKGDEYVDLKGTTMLPAFIEAHGHFMAHVYQKLQVNLFECEYIEDLKFKVSTFEKNLSNPKKWVICKNFCIEHFKSEPLTLSTLDSICSRPLLIYALDGSIFANSKAMKALKVEDTFHILDIKPFEKRIKSPTLEDFLEAVTLTTNEYFASGYTTAQEGLLVPALYPLYVHLTQSECLTIDVVGYPNMDSFEQFGNYFSNDYHDHFRIGGMTILLDGKPHLKKSYLKNPYLHSQEMGYPNISTKNLREQIDWSLKEHQPLLFQAYGDQAVEQIFYNLKWYDKQQVKQSKSTIVGATMMGADQLHKAKRYHLSLAYDGNAISKWADKYVSLFGKERTKLMNPIHSTFSRSINCSIYDGGVSSVHALKTAKDACTRQTKSGIIWGKNEQISIIKALQALTLHPAIQYGEEDKKGSIMQGKLANFVILNSNPLTLKKEELSNVEVLTTIMNGKVVYQKNEK